MKKIILVVSCMILYATIVEGKPINNVKNINIKLTTSNGKQFYSNNNGYSWNEIENTVPIVKLKKSNGQLFVSYNKGRSWESQNNFIKSNVTLSKMIINEYITINGIEKSFSGSLDIECFDLFGNTIFKKTILLNNTATKLQINVSFLTNGYYFLKLSDGSTTKLIYFIKY